HLDAFGRCDVALRLDVLPGGVVAFRPDQGEDLVLAAVLPYQSCCQAQAPTSLKIRRHPEDRGRQEMYLVVDDQAPVARIEEVQVRVDPFSFGGQHLVGRDRDRTDLLAGSGVLTDL